jgi:hypothetical protein
MKGIHRGPVNFVHRAGNIVYSRSHSGYADLLTDLSIFRPAASFDPLNYPGVKRYFVDPAGGNDANTGADFSNALKRISTALAKSDVDVVVCKGGAIYRIDSTATQSIGEYAGARDITMIAVGGKAILTTAREVTWTENATFTNVYESSSTGGTIVSVVDLDRIDNNGDYVKLVPVSSIAAVDTTPDSWFFESNKAYIRIADDVVPTDRILAMRSSLSRVSADNIKWYMKGFHFIGGSAGAFSARDATVNTVVWAEDCWFTHQHLADGYQIKDVGLSIAINCRASANANDGFNYHALNGITPHFIEIDCVGMGNLEGDSGNGSTAHEGVVGLRMNCDYFGNLGPGIADIDQSKTLNINVTSRGNPAPFASGVLANGTAEVWYDGLSCDDNESTDVRLEANAIFHHRDIVLEDLSPVNVSGTASIDSNFS